MKSSTHSGFDLIIFDCDGVLVDSERVANQVFAEILKEICGLEFSLADMFDHFVGHSQAQCMKTVERLTGRPAPAELAERYQQEINQALINSVEAVAGIEQALEQIEIPYCVASSGSYEKMELTLGKTNLLRFFGDNIFSTSDVDRGKPFPDIYLHAAQAMGGCAPKLCLVIEDSPIGVTGAVAAEMTVFGFADLMPAQKLIAAGAHHIFKQMSQLPSLTVSASALI